MVLLLLCVAVPLHAQSAARQISGTVVDGRGAPVSGAAIDSPSGRVLGKTSAAGSFTVAVPAPNGKLLIESPGYRAVTVSYTQGKRLRVLLSQGQQTVTVTAYGTPLASIDSAANTRVLDREQLREGASASLAGKLRQVPGLELFRRSSSLVSNPTSQGISLRGLGSTAASRTLVVTEDIPLNDPYGGWIHWEELPELSIRSTEVMRGGASDLYGSSAMGGVINLLPVEPTKSRFVLSASHGSLNTNDDAALGSLKHGPWGGLATGGILNTDGYTLVAPDERGPIDTPSNLHSENGLIELQRTLRDGGRIFLRGSGYNDARDNGTPLQKNAARLWRAAAGVDWADIVLRLYGSSEHYRQTFSFIHPGRNAETLTRFAENPATELGAQLHWRKPIGARLLILAGADTHDVRAADNEVAFTGSGGLLDTAARQRQTGVYAEALYTPAKWTISGSARVDHFSNFDAVRHTQNSQTQLPSFSETVFDPRIGIVRRLTPGVAINASAFRAYRAPTENELYRTGQVGQKITKPNPNLRSERATGWETGLVTSIARWNSTARVSYFWNQVNRPITALTLSVTPTQTLLERENLGQIESRGVSLDYEIAPVRWMSLDGGYQYADATVTRFKQEPELVGKWIPQVSRNMATAQARFSEEKIGTLSLQGRISGRQFDDDRNLYLLHGYFRLDVYVSHQLGRHFELFATGKNVFNRAIEVGRTPTLTLGTPREGRFGLRVRFGG